MQAGSLGITAVVIIALVGVALLVAVLMAIPRLRELADAAQLTLGNAQRALFQVEQLALQLRTAGIIERLSAALASAQATVGRIDPLAGQFSDTLTGARELLDDAKETSQSVRARVDDLAATQRELTALTSALTDVVGEVRDRELAKRLSDVLADTSLLAADIGVLAENASSMLEGGKPLVSGIGGVVGNARRRASGISSALGGIRAGIKAGVDSWRDKGDDKA
jgi:hypothetical protein